MRRRLAAVAAMAFVAATPAWAGDVTIPGTPPLQAELGVPAGPVRGAAVVGLHGCGGPAPARSGQWRDVLNAAGHPVVLPDSFGSRGLGPQCRNADRTVRAMVERRDDALSAADWMRSKPFGQGGVVLVGWSNGASTALAAAGRAQPGQLRGVVAFYPGCRAFLERPGWQPSAPVLLLIGEADDWTPAEPCRELAARFPDRITLVTYPGAFHGFDAPDQPIRVRRGLAFTASGSGEAHVGTDPAARADVLRRVPAFIAGLSP